MRCASLRSPLMRPVPQLRMEEGALSGRWTITVFLASPRLLRIPSTMSCFGRGRTPPQAVRTRLFHTPTRSGCSWALTSSSRCRRGVRASKCSHRQPCAPSLQGRRISRSPVAWAYNSPPSLSTQAGIRRSSRIAHLAHGTIALTRSCPPGSPACLSRGVLRMVMARWIPSGACGHPRSASYNTGWC